MAYSLAKIDIRELKANQPVGVQTFELILGLIPIEVEGYTQIADNTEPAADEWSYFPKIKTLKINNSVLQAEQYLKYSLLVSNKNSASYALDPTNAVATKYIWPPYLKSAPTVTESGKNILEGIITYNSISIDIQTSTETKTANYFGSNFSIMNQDFSLFRITNAGTITKLYTGIGTGVSASSNSIKISTKPKIQLLDEPAYYDLMFTRLFVDPSNPSYISSNPYYSVDKTAVPIICASVIPYTVKSIKGNDEDINFRGVFDYKATDQPVKYFDKTTLVKAEAEHAGNTFKFWVGIVFSNWNESDYVISNLETQLTNKSTLNATQALTQRLVIGPYYWSQNPLTTAYNANLTYEPLPYDWGRVNNQQNQTLVLRNWFEQDFSGSTHFCTKWYGKRFLSLPLSGNSFTRKRRFKMLFANNTNLNEQGGNFSASNYRNLQDTDEIGDVTTNFSKDAPRMIPYDICTPRNWRPSDAYNQSGRSNNGATFLEMSATLGTYSDDANDNTIGSFYTDLQSQPAGDDNCFEYYYQHEIPVDHASLSMQNFLDITLTAAFRSSPDLTELDFNESMQMIEYTNQSYRQLLEKMLPSIGCFVTYDQDNEQAKLIKIDPTKAVSDTLTENDFGSLTSNLNTADTFSVVNFKNETMFQGENTRDNFLAYQFDKFVYANETTYEINITDKLKTINMLTMQSSRADEIGQWYIDNKFIYKWKTPAEDRFLNLQLGDTIYINSDLVLEPSNQAKILITQRSISETSISFEGIKFASIN